MVEKAKKKSFIFNVEWQEILLGYPSEVRLEVYDAIIEYVASGTILELKPMAKMAFSFIKKEIDYNTCKYNDIVAKRSEAGKKAMNKRYNKDVTNLTNDSKSNKCYQDTTNLTVNDNDNVNESPNGDKVDAFLPEISDKPLKECYEELSANSSWIETVVINKRSAGHQDFTWNISRNISKNSLKNFKMREKSVKALKTEWLILLGGWILNSGSPKRTCIRRRTNSYCCLSKRTREGTTNSCRTSRGKLRIVFQICGCLPRKSSCYYGVNTGMRCLKAHCAPLKAGQTYVLNGMSCIMLS